MADTVCDLIGKDLVGYKLVNASILELDHDLMGNFLAIFSASREPVIFVDDKILAAAKSRLEQRRSKTQEMLFLLDRDGTSGFALSGDKPLLNKRRRVYTSFDHEEYVPIEWDPRLLALS